MAKKDTKVSVKTEEEVLKPITMIPRATEKTYLEQTKRTYVFPVDRSASKQLIASKVADEYNVTVVSVRTLVRKGKPTRFSRGKHAYPGTTHRQDKKFAYVTLAEGNSIKVFEEEEAPAPKEEKKAEKEKKSLLKKADKKENKEEKK